ncbi:MAG: 2' O-ribose methyltransferase [Alectoria fallacina]|uniref:rRNA methyltransferase 2, mitochondrial n=1 Tax=Alectoria fallacina TaxID=1903189 RepID=A0A8H3EYF0_9LECA|nr:MAG: 2' O-ribose methyltransferase [Alectoria fallacina]
MAYISNYIPPPPPPNDGWYDKRKINLPSTPKYKINKKYKIFRGGQTVVDLGYAPGSWSQVAVDRTFPNGRVLGIDIIPAQPPKGVSTIQGNFLSSAVQEEVKRFLRDSDRGRIKQEPSFIAEDGEDQMRKENLEQSSWSYLELEKRVDSGTSSRADPAAQNIRADGSRTGKVDSGVVDVVLSDMSEPWEQTHGFWKRSLSDPYYRMMNTSGVRFRDHAGSMDLCDAALRFSFDTLRAGGHFVCKFYQGSEDKALELRLKNLFSKVHREKPESSRSESKEAYFVALRRRPGSERNDGFEHN